MPNNIYSLTDSTYGINYSDPSQIEIGESLFKHLIKGDHSLAEHKKKSLLTMLNSPEAFDHLMAGAAGALITKAATNYINMSKPAQTLLSLAGFGLGNIIYNSLQNQKFSTYDTSTGMSKIKL
jgi:hypothetical protein